MWYGREVVGMEEVVGVEWGRRMTREPICICSLLAVYVSLLANIGVL